MELDFWHSRWQSGQIGWHQSAVNPYLVELWDSLEIPKAAAVFVPLCGKSKDMMWLAEQGVAVVGIELSQVAVSEFFAENGLEPEVQTEDGFEIWCAGDIRILCGDFFSLRTEMLTDVGFVYDRASLIAFPPAMREEYTTKMAELFPKGLATLLITLEYQQQEMDGPPFSVLQQEVDQRYAGNYNIELLKSVDVLAGHERFRQRGLTALHERIYQLMPIQD
ncbi:MAG: thiopurine S-methyltransferase [bacterium]